MKQRKYFVELWNTVQTIKTWISLEGSFSYKGGKIRSVLLYCDSSMPITCSQVNCKFAVNSTKITIKKFGITWYTLDSVQIYSWMLNPIQQLQWHFPCLSNDNVNIYNSCHFCYSEHLKQHHLHAHHSFSSSKIKLRLASQR